MRKKVLLKASKQTVENMQRMQKNRFYNNMVKQKDADYNRKLELLRLESDRSAALPPIADRIKILKK